MTEKRFTTVELPMPTIWGIWYDGAYLSTNRICMLLNEYVDVRNENEQLKSRVGYLERKIDRERISHQKQHEKWEEEIQKENEQLEKELKVYRKLARCSNCEHHGYDWFDDGEEFEVCDKGNDVTERICEDWEEL